MMGTWQTSEVIRRLGEADREERGSALVLHMASLDPADTPAARLAPSAQALAHRSGLLAGTP
jgi:hypothetical protein